MLRPLTFCLDVCHVFVERVARRSLAVFVLLAHQVTNWFDGDEMVTVNGLGSSRPLSVGIL